jgi:hypothetical protein
VTDHATWPETADAPARDAPSVEELLDVDREYRDSRRATLHTTRDDRTYSALCSPSAMARRMGRSEDWVIIELDEPGPNPHWTVVTEWRGVLRGKRVVRGREVECYKYYHSAGRRRRHGSQLKVAG